MLFIRLWNYLRGYVIIRIEGLILENFINLTTSKGIYLWDIRRVDYTIIEAKIGIGAFKELRDVVKKVGCRVNIKHKYGFPFILSKIRYRKLFVVGFFLAIFILFILTSLIWSIDIVGEENISHEEVMDNLNKMGVYVGVNKKDIELEGIKRMILRELDNISYAKAEFKGTKLIIELKGRDKPPKLIDDTEPCNIVSSKQAVIEKIIAKNGKSVVNKGDVVEKGQLLITGKVEDERFEEPLLVHSEGVVLGRTLYKQTLKEPIYRIIKKETGEVFKIRQILIKDKKIMLSNGVIPYENYIKNTKVNRLFSIKFITNEYREIELERLKQDPNELKRINALKGIETLVNSLPENAKVLSKEIKHITKDNNIITNITIEVLEEIGEKQKI